MTTQNSISVSVIGSGNVASHLSKALFSKGFKIDCIYSRNVHNANMLADVVSAESKGIETTINCSSNIVVISVSDDAIVNVIDNMQVNDDTIVVHTSGSVDLSVFEHKMKRYGTIYPLQTFSKGREVDFSVIPIFVDASDAETLKVLWNVANVLSPNNIHHVDYHTRLKIHVAAVFACNFTNAMYSVAADILRDEMLGFDILKPLIGETACKALAVDDPKIVQTGPAVRGDGTIIDKHLNVLSQKTPYNEIYKLITNAISEMSTKKQ